MIESTRLTPLCLTVTNKFVESMVKRLEANSWKGDSWRLMKPSDLLRRLHVEVRELERSVRHGSSMQVCHEAADVANFAMFLADRLRNRKAEGTRS